MSHNRAALLAISALLTLSAGCDTKAPIDEGPTAEDVTQSTGLTVQEATKTAAEFVSLVAGVPFQPDPTAPRRSVAEPTPTR
ncbi:hypothetical protein [Antrihabitans spumae]|jgi:hypothetical protein|uniref:Uncharacterized protein n=1 Tax=Antrihabitans spumae TaxID=3373370 RepID=A0ABW7KT15_9NOCA